MAKIPTSPSKTLNSRMIAIFGQYGDMWRMANKLITLIDAGTLTGQIVVEELNRAVGMHANLDALAGGAGNADVRTEIANQFSIADINTDMAATKTIIETMMADMETILTTIAGSGQVVTANDTTGRQDTVVTSGQSTALRANAILLRDTYVEDPSA